TYGRGMWESELYTTPVANFTVSDVSVCEDEPVTFTDQSSGTYNSLSWTFSSGSPGTSSERNPQVSYPVAGTYTVQLSISNDIESDLEVKTNYITVSTCGARRSVLGVEEESAAEGIKVFPNPASSTISVDLSNAKGRSFELTVIDAGGRTILNRKVE